MYAYTLIRSHSEPSVLWAKQSHVSLPFLVAEMLQSLHHLSGPLLGLFQELHMSLVLGSPRTRHSTPGVA